MSVTEIRQSHSMTTTARTLRLAALLPFTALALMSAPTAHAAGRAPADVVATLSTGRAAALRAAYADRLLALEKTATSETLLKSDDYRTALAAHEVLRVTGDKSVDAAVASDPEFPKFLAAFLPDREWTGAYLASGNVPTDTVHGLATLFAIWKADGASADFGKYKQLSAAVASAWGAGRNAESLRDGLRAKPFNIDPVWRFKFYKDRHKAGRLHPMFAGLKSWELHYVVAKVWDDASLAWLNDNINVPLARYPDVCWSVRYRGESDFGDTIQGPLFYAPWSPTMCTAENVKVHGGVCGSLSTFGATAASAHGIPSYTCGQPGHCAYAVRFARGEWVGGFGGPDGSPHVSIFPGNIHYVDLMEAVFGDDAGLDLALAQAARSRLLLASGDIAGAVAAMGAAVKASPLHPDLRREQIALLEKSGGMTPAGWREYAAGLLAAFGKHSDPAIALTRTFDEKFLKGAGDAEKLAWYAKIHDAAARATPSWAWANEIDDRILAPEFKSLNSDESREELLRIALAAHLNSGDGAYFGKVLEWGIKGFVEKGKADDFGRAFAAASSGGSAKIEDKKLREAYDRAIVAACEARSIPAFQALGKAALRFAGASPGPDKLNKPPGKLVSADGVLRLSSQAWCSGVDFYNVLNETGGVVHTKAEAAPSVIVELPRTVELSGVLVVKNRGNEWRMRKVRVSRSVDGATWFPVEETPDMPSQWRIDAPADTRARWIKVEALNEKPEVMHFRNILVFSKE